MSRKNRFVYRTGASNQQCHCVFFYLTMQDANYGDFYHLPSWIKIVLSFDQMLPTSNLVAKPTSSTADLTPGLSKSWPHKSFLHFGYQALMSLLTEFLSCAPSRKTISMDLSAKCDAASTLSIFNISTFLKGDIFFLNSVEFTNLFRSNG